jgi:Tol biopolymer transport system component
MNAKRAALAVLAAALMITSVAAAVPAAVADFEQSEEPAWSPDGRKIAFVSDRAGNAEIYVMNADGSEQRRLTRNAAPDFGPAWSPDGRKIAFQSLRNAGPRACSQAHVSAGCNWELYVMNADGSGQRRLTRDPGLDRGATWSPDGRELLFGRAPWEQGALRRSPGFWIMNADGSDQRRLVTADRTAAWSPDGRMIAFSRKAGSNREIYVIRPDGSGQRALTHNPGVDADPTWSPDGRKIAFLGRREPGNNVDVYVMNADGTGQRNLTRNTASYFYSPVAWSPDGRKMTFVSDRAGNAEIYVMNADGSGQRRLTRDPGIDGDATWSPNGGKIAFVSGGDPLTGSGRGIYVMNADGSGQRRLTPRASTSG